MLFKVNIHCWSELKTGKSDLIPIFSGAPAKDFYNKIKGEKEEEYTYDYELSVHNMLMDSVKNVN